MAGYTGSSNGGPPSSSGYAPYAPSNLRQNYPHFEEEDPVGDFLRHLKHQMQSLQHLWNTRGKRATLAFLYELAHQLRRNLTLRRLSSFPHLLVVIWALVLLWGERWIFHTKVESCHWSNWEKWVITSPSSRRRHPTKQPQEADYRLLSLAIRCHASPSDLRRGPSANRSALLPRATLAHQFIDCHGHRQLHAPVVLPAARAITP